MTTKTKVAAAVPGLRLKKRQYRVTWTIDVEAESPVKAAIAARKAQEPGSSALVFRCVDKKTKKGVYVDLWE